MEATYVGVTKQYTLLMSAIFLLCRLIILTQVRHDRLFKRLARLCAACVYLDFQNLVPFLKYSTFSGDKVSLTLNGEPPISHLAISGTCYFPLYIEDCELKYSMGYFTHQNFFRNPFFPYNLSQKTKQYKIITYCRGTILPQQGKCP